MLISEVKSGNPTNGNFFGILKLLAQYDSHLNAHPRKVRHFQETGEILQVHYLSEDIQNEFMIVYANEAVNFILPE